MFEKFLIPAYAAKPDGYYQVHSGPIRPDDLLWSPMEKIYRRADDPEWLFPAPEDAELACCVIRKARYEKAPEQTSRAYTIKRVPLTPAQGDLF